MSFAILNVNFCAKLLFTIDLSLNYKFLAVIYFYINLRLIIDSVG